jgi:hypothetical protein
MILFDNHSCFLQKKYFGHIQRYLYLIEYLQIIEYLRKSLEHNIMKIYENSFVDGNIFQTKALAII